MSGAERSAPPTSCPGCGARMRALAMVRKPLGQSVVDVCDRCHALWFDAHESAQMTPGSIIDLFREVAAAPAPMRAALPEAMQCPRCRASLATTQDLRHTVRFSYWRCPKGHGRFTPFVQFLREKDFIRPLTAPELARLKAHVRTIRCSGCGAPVDLRRDLVCSFCRSPVEALDPAALAATLESLGEAHRRSTTIDVDALADAVVAAHRPPALAPPAGKKGSVEATDLIAAGVSIIVAALAR